MGDTVIFWFTFNPGLELTGFQTTWLLDMSLRSNQKTSTWSEVNFNKTCELDEL